MSIITYGGGAPITPMQTLTESYESEAESGTVPHSILDGPPVHTLRAAGPDRGTLHLLFADEAQALGARAAHRLAAVFTIADPRRELLNFRYVTRGRMQLRLDRQARRRWVLTVPYEVIP